MILLALRGVYPIYIPKGYHVPKNDKKEVDSNEVS